MAFSYYSPVTVNAGQVPSTQTDFPILISQTDARFKTVGNGGHVQNSSGFDIRPYSDSALTLALTYELERYNASTGEVVMWVKIPSLANGSVVYLGYGDASLTTDGSSASTWSNGFVAVYHFKDGTTLSVADATGAHNGVNSGATAAAGQIDGGAGFVSASSQYINTSQTLVTAFTISAWVKATSFPNAYNTLYGQQNAAVFKNLSVKSSGKLGCFVLASATVSYDGTGSHTLSAGTWYYLTMTYNSSTGLIGYVNAVSDGTAAANGAAGSSATTTIGQDPVNAGRFWNGALDEVRSANVARSADWITTEYNNQSAPGTFETLGTETSTTVASISFCGGE